MKMSMVLANKKKTRGRLKVKQLKNFEKHCQSEQTYDDYRTKNKRRNWVTIEKTPSFRFDYVKFRVIECASVNYKTITGDIRHMGI